MIHDVQMPDIGEKIESGTVVSILVSIGNRVNKDDGIIEIETDKALLEIPSPITGTVVEILVQEGDIINIGDVIARLETEDAVLNTSIKEKEAKTPDDPPSLQVEPEEQSLADSDRAIAPTTGQSFKKDDVSQGLPKPGDRELPVAAAPSIRRQARELGVDIKKVRGSGPGGRITEKDVKNYVKYRLTTAIIDRSSISKTPSEIEFPDFSRWGPVKVSDMTTVRRLTSESMSLSWDTIPHVTQFDQADITHVNEWLQTARKNTKPIDGKLTITAVLLKVVAEALKEFPRFNASLDFDRQQIIFKDYFHIGLAVDTQRGLLVPVIRDVDQKTIMEIANEIYDLSNRARNKRLTSNEMEGGTFTISNQGGIGGVNFTPIIYWPQAAILGVSRAIVKPRYIDGEWHPRTVLPLSLSYDHRLNDGADAARFLGWICHALQYPLAMQ